MTPQAQHEQRSDPDPDLSAALHAALQAVPPPPSTVDVVVARRRGTRQRFVRRQLPRAALLAGAGAAGIAAVFAWSSPPSTTTQLSPPVTAATENTVEPGPFDSSAEMRPDLMTVAPSPVIPGSLIDVGFPEGTLRGVAFVLEQETTQGWQLRYFIASGRGDSPRWAPAASGFFWVDVGVRGVGPDVLEVPEPASAGSYRLCTANSPQNICTPLKISPEP